MIRRVKGGTRALLKLLSEELAATLLIQVKYLLLYAQKRKRKRHFTSTSLV